MDDITDIGGLDPQSAKEYVLAFIMTLKNTRRDRQKLQDELALWKRRVKLAEEKGESELKTAAEDRSAELSARLELLTGEERDLENKVAVLKANIRHLKNRAALSIDPDFLLAQLNMLVGERDTLSEAFQHEEAQSALDELKKKLQNQEGKKNQDP